MKKISHIAIGILTGIAFSLPITTSVIGALAPDIDVKWTKSSQSLVYSHRGITHHVLLAFFLIILTIVINNIWFTGFTSGYLSHLFSDMLTKSGIPYWKHKDRIAVKLFSTGEKYEFGFVLSLSASIIIMMILLDVKAVIPFEVHYLFAHLDLIKNLILHL
jgi:membrane-bound metal-dependent hydrolase YbcI (DUF457 family)